MGISGTGKTTVGSALAARLGVAYADGDAFHSPANVAKMASGVPLGDDDRLPWLAQVGDWLRAHEQVGAVVSCSALRRLYRDTLTQRAPGAIFLHLSGNPSLIEQRVRERHGHFMPASLVISQLETLEPLTADERGVVLDVGASPAQIVETFVAQLPHFA
jgi:gluconokinase